MRLWQRLTLVVVLAGLVASLVVPAVLAGGAPPAASGGDTMLTGQTWYWQESIRGDNSRTRPSDSLRYTLTFGTDGEVQAQVDCNRGFGPFTTGPGGRITIGPLATTRMLCPSGSLDSRFLTDLDQIDRYTLLSAVTLRLEPRGEASTMIFTRLP